MIRSLSENNLKSKHNEKWKDYKSNLKNIKFNLNYKNMMLTKQIEYNSSLPILKMLEMRTRSRIKTQIKNSDLNLKVADCPINAQFQAHLHPRHIKHLKSLNVDSYSMVKRPTAVSLSPSTITSGLIQNLIIDLDVNSNVLDYLKDEAKFKNVLSKSKIVSKSDTTQIDQLIEMYESSKDRNKILFSISQTSFQVNKDFEPVFLQLKYKNLQNLFNLHNLKELAKRNNKQMDRKLPLKEENILKVQGDFIAQCRASFIELYQIESDKNIAQQTQVCVVISNPNDKNNQNYKLLKDYYKMTLFQTIETLLQEYEMVDQYLVNHNLKTVVFLVIQMQGNEQSHFIDANTREDRKKLENLNLVNFPSCENLIMDYKQVNSDFNKNISHWRKYKFIDILDQINDYDNTFELNEFKQYIQDHPLNNIQSIIDQNPILFTEKTKEEQLQLDDFSDVSNIIVREIDDFESTFKTIVYNKDIESIDEHYWEFVKNKSAFKQKNEVMSTQTYFTFDLTIKFVSNSSPSFTNVSSKRWINEFLSQDWVLNTDNQSQRDDQVKELSLGLLVNIVDQDFSSGQQNMTQQNTILKQQLKSN